MTRLAAAVVAAAASPLPGLVSAAASSCSANGPPGHPDSCEAPAVLSAPPAMLQRKSALQTQRRANLTEDSSDDECCSGFAQWPAVDGGVTCDACTALVQTGPYQNRCDIYCSSFGHVCVGAFEEVADNCAVKYAARCDQPILGTSDMLCRCRRPNAPQKCDAAPAAPPSGGKIQVRGRQLLVDGKPVHLKGVAWNPVGRGHRHTNFAAFVDRDVVLLKQAGVNAVRTYTPITDRGVLDKLWANGIWVANGVYQYGGAPASSVIGAIEAVKDHPAILMWTIGNEWNYNGLYTHMPLWDAAGRLQQVASIIKQHDREHPVASIFGELRDIQAVDARMPDVDLWGVNSYRGISFGGLFDGYAAVLSKPMFLGEYGADAFNALIGREDQDAQARATAALTHEILAHSSLTGGPCIGGFVFELADEWWKDGKGSSNVHDIGGSAPGGGPYPDKTFNEEWWGLVDIDRTPRAALRALSEVSVPVVATA